MVFNSKFCSFIGVLSFLTLNVTAQVRVQPDSVVHFTSIRVDSAASSKRTPDKPGRLLATSKEKAPYLVVVRMSEGAVEIHEQYDDVAIIRSGHGILRTGYEIKGAKLNGQTPTREWLGGTIVDKRDRKIGAGDFLVIPAMLGHQYIPNAGDSLVYYTIKVRHPKK